MLFLNECNKNNAGVIEVYFRSVGGDLEGYYDVKGSIGGFRDSNPHISVQGLWLLLRLCYSILLTM